MRMRAPRGVALVTAAALAVGLGAALAGCGTASDPSPPAGVDELTVPTPTPDPGDFVAGVDNAWLPLPTGRTWTYTVIDAAGARRLEVSVTEGPQVAGVDTTARVAEEDGDVTTDWFAQDTDGNVWWFGRAGEWQAGVDGAEAGLAMPARPRVGDGFRTGYLAGAVEDVVTVLSLDGSATTPSGSYGGLLVTRETSTLDPDRSVERSWGRGLGLVEERSSGRTVRLTAVD